MLWRCFKQKIEAGYVAIKHFKKIGENINTFIKNSHEQALYYLNISDHLLFVITKLLKINIL